MREAQAAMDETLPDRGGVEVEKLKLRS